MKIKVHNLVYQTLVDYPETRGDDYELIYRVLETYVTPELSLAAVLRNHVALGIPSIATITRCRRKIQETHKELIDTNAQRRRKKEEEEFRNYAINY